MKFNTFILLIVLGFLFNGCGKLEKSDLVSPTDSLCSFSGKINYQLYKNVSTDFDSNNVKMYLKVSSSSCKNVESGTQLPMTQLRVVRVENTINFVDEQESSKTVQVTNNNLTSMEFESFSDSFELKLKFFNGKLDDTTQSIQYDFRADSIRLIPTIQNTQIKASPNKMMSQLINLMVSK